MGAVQIVSEISSVEDVFYSECKCQTFLVESVGRLTLQMREAQNTHQIQSQRLCIWSFFERKILKVPEDIIEVYNFWNLFTKESWPVIFLLMGVEINGQQLGIFDLDFVPHSRQQNPMKVMVFQVPRTLKINPSTIGIWRVVAAEDTFGKLVSCANSSKKENGAILVSRIMYESLFSACVWMHKRLSPWRQ